MTAFLLTLAIALLLVRAFWRRNLKPAVRDLWTCLALRAPKLWCERAEHLTGRGRANMLCRAGQ
jgi:hypothetical protein